MHGTGACDGIVEDCYFSGSFRSTITADFGNSKWRLARNTSVCSKGLVTDSDNIAAGFMIGTEMLGYGTGGSSSSPSQWYMDWQQTDDYGANGDTDIVLVDGPQSILGCTIGPGWQFYAKHTIGTPVMLIGSSAARRGTMYFHRQVGNYPRSTFGGWTGQYPHTCTIQLVDQDIITWGPQPWWYHEKLIVPGPGETWTIQIGETVRTSDGAGTGWHAERDLSPLHDGQGADHDAGFPHRRPDHRHRLRAGCDQAERPAAGIPERQPRRLPERQHPADLPRRRRVCADLGADGRSADRCSRRRALGCHGGVTPCYHEPAERVQQRQQVIVRFEVRRSPGRGCGAPRP
jgi:hypothetical protein